VESFPGAGSTFKVYLPAQVMAREPESVEDEPDRTPCPRGSGESILLVEDDPDVAALTLNLLSESGYAVCSYGTATEACKAFGQPGASWDLLLSDAVLPDGRGIELIRRLRLQQPSLEAILFSGHTDERASLDQIRQDGLLFLHKPYAATDLLGNVREAMKRRVAQK
jgi:DNA-binding NtrC family response regulator